jgi:hypothetical protein
MPIRPSPPKSSAWRSAIRSAIGIRSSPIPRKSGARATYIRPEAARIWPQERRRATRRAAAGRHVVRATAKRTSASSAASPSRTTAGSCSQRISPIEPPATATQKKSVAWVPRRPPVGTA